MTNTGLIKAMVMVTVIIWFTLILPISRQVKHSTKKYFWCTLLTITYRILYYLCFQTCYKDCCSYSRQGTDRLIAQKDYCMDTLSKLVPLADATLEITSLVVPQANWARTGKNIVSLMSDLLRSSHGMRSGRSPER